MKRRARLSRIVFCLFVMVPVFWASSSLEARTICVPDDYQTIQAAIDVADPGDTVSVKPGIYTGSENVDLVIQGRSIRIEGSGRDSCIIDCEGSGRAFTFTGIETSESVLTGFTFKGGKVTDNGGAILCNNGASPTIDDCIITSNSATGYGGGIACENGASPTIDDCVVTENEAKYGGGISCRGGSSPTISDCDIEANTSASGGGGLYCSSSSPTIEECSISKNEGGYYGAGVYLFSSSPSLLSSLIALNSATYYGGGIWCSNSSSPKITNCTVADNLVKDPNYSAGGGIFSSNSSIRITNSIFWNDAAVVNGREIYLASSQLYVSYSDVQGGKGAAVVNSSAPEWDDVTNKDADPLFVGQDDYHLSPGSPCIDTGIDTGDLPEVDFEGDDRIINDKPDIGADEARTEVIVDIDIKPGSRHKEIDLHQKGIVPVAVLSSKYKGFDARMIDPKSVVFAGAAPVRSVLNNVNRNYHLDMVFFFKTQQLDLDENSSEATLTGKTVDGVSFRGTDSVTIYKPKWKAKNWWKSAKVKHMYRHKHLHRHCSK